MLAALAAGVEAGDDDAARAQLGHADWVLRGPARRQLERALMDAVLLTGELYSAGDAEALRHVQRAAALSVAGTADVDFTDRARVTAAYHHLPAEAPPRAPVATILAATAAVLCIAFGAWGVVALRTPHHHVRPPAPPVTGAFATGGSPARDPALEQLLGEDLANLVVETDGDRHGSGDDPGRKLHLIDLRASAVVAARGAGLTAAWRDMLDALDHFVDVPTRTREFAGAEQDLRERVHAVSDQLAALGLGYFLDGDVMVDKHVAHAVVFAYRVEDVVFVHVDNAKVRVLSLRRLDHLNLRRTVLGMQSELLGDPVVMLDQIDDFIATHVAPVLAGAPYPVGDDMWRDSWSGRRLAGVAGDAVRGELAGRADVRDIVTASVRRHEARHAYDSDREPPLRYPEALRAYLGTASETDPFVRRARAELAAYLSQIANDRIAPQLALWNAASLALTHERAGTPEAYAAAVIIEGLAGRSLAHAVGKYERAQLADLAVPLAGLTGAQLRDRARELWRQLYAAPCLPIAE